MRFYFLLFSLIPPTICHSQSGFESILLASESNSKKIYNSYLNPLMKRAIYSSNSGWYNTAKVHKMLGQYDLECLTQSNTPVKKTLQDPIDMNSNTSDFQISFVVKYNFLIFNAFLDFTFQEYNTLSMGIVTNFR